MSFMKNAVVYYLLSEILISLLARQGCVGTLHRGNESTRQALLPRGFLLYSALSLNCPVLAGNKVYSLPLCSLSQVHKECAFRGVHLGPFL